MELKPLLKDIADAIREKDGTAEPIAAGAFPARIRAIPAGGGEASRTARPSVDLRDCAMTRADLAELFHSLPAVTTAGTLTLTGNPGAAELTAEDKAIAQDKNWTLYI